MALICAIDDDQSTLRLLDFALRQAGHVVHCAPTRVLAEKLLKEHDFALIVLDLHMPDTTGFSLLKSIRSNPKTIHTPVLMLTGEACTEVACKSRELGASGYLVKPIRRDIFVQRVDDMLLNASTRSVA